MMNDLEKDRRINEFADRFEEIWNSGQRIDADEFLARFVGEETVCQELREELSMVEQELRQKYPKTSFPGEPIQRIGNYELLEQIGRGGMGEVYRARQVFLDRIDAVKVVQDKIAEIPEVAERFERELKLIGNLSHQNIVRAYGTEQTDDGKLLLAMEFIEGTSLQQLVDSGQKMPVDKALAIVHQVATGLQYAHERKIVHRDIKPANIMLTADGTAKILDFGLGKFYSERSDSSDTLTKMGTPFGTLDYTSPEQCRDPGGVDIRTDIYALGCTFYTIVVGGVPYPSNKFGSIPAKILAHIDQPPPSFLASGVEVSPDVEVILQKMCAKNHNRRFATPLELIDAIDAYQHVIVSVDARGKKRSFARWWVIAGILATCVLGLAFFFMPPNGNKPDDFSPFVQEVLTARYSGDLEEARQLCRDWLDSILGTSSQRSQIARVKELLADSTLYSNDLDLLGCEAHVKEIVDMYLQAIKATDCVEKKSILNGKLAILAVISCWDGTLIIESETNSKVGKGILFFEVAKGIDNFYFPATSSDRHQSLIGALGKLHEHDPSIEPQLDDPWKMELFDLRLLCIRPFLLHLKDDPNPDEAMLQDIMLQDMKEYMDSFLRGAMARNELRFYLREDFEQIIRYYQGNWREQARFIRYMRGDVLSRGSALLIFHFTDIGGIAILLPGNSSVPEGFPLPWNRQTLRGNRGNPGYLHQQLRSVGRLEEWNDFVNLVKAEPKVALSWSDEMCHPNDGLSEEDYPFGYWPEESRLEWKNFDPAK